MIEHEGAGKLYFPLTGCKAPENICGMLLNNSMQVFRRKRESLAHAFNALCENDADLPLPDRNGGNMTLVMRRWRCGLFRQFRRDREESC